MQSKKLAGAKPSVSTKQHLDISEIRDNIVVLKDGTVRAVLFCSSVNFALKSEEEQQALISAYVSLLNSLEYPLQIVIQSRRLNIEDYLERLKQVEKEQANTLLKVQTADYRKFVSELVQLGQITEKRFYVIVPYNPLSDKRKGFFSRFREAFAPALIVRLREKQFEERKSALLSRVEHTITALGSMSVKAIMLDTQGLIELYYDAYNPDIRETQKLSEIEQLQVESA